MKLAQIYFIRTILNNQFDICLSPLSTPITWKGMELDIWKKLLGNQVKKGYLPVTIFQKYNLQIRTS